MDLPTYTSIWRIEKRLYKLYDFRLPMPLPISQMAVFAAIAVPYVVLLTVLGLPLNHTLIWVYILPPGLLTWLATRPVLEGKRLPELIKSQLRYLAEPKVWCRMAPSSERDVVLVTGRIWRPARAARRDRPATMTMTTGRRPPAMRPGDTRPDRVRAARPVAARERVRARARSAEPKVTAPAEMAHGLGPLPPRPAWARPPAEPELIERELIEREPAEPEPVDAELADQALDDPMFAGVGLAEAGLELADPGLDGPELTEPELTEPELTEPELTGAGLPAGGPDEADEPDEPFQAQQPAAPRRPSVTVVGASRTAPVSVERALAGPAARRGDGRPSRVTVVPGGDRPGRPDQLQRDRARAQQPLAWPARVVMLGCTVGAGQTVTALLTGEVLASLRTDQVAVLDLNPGVSSLRRRAVHRPALSQAASLSSSRLTVLGPDGLEGGTDETGEEGYLPRPDPAQDALAFELAAQEHDIVLADPSTTVVPRLLGYADQLVLVAPASAAAASSITMTVEWLDAHGQSDLVAGSIMVLNGVSRRSMPQVDAAERICAGQCRAIVRVPWDDQLDSHLGRRSQPAGKHSAAAGQPHGGQHGAGQHWAGLLSPATVSAYTALAGVLVTALTKREVPEPAAHRPAARGQASR